MKLVFNNIAADDRLIDGYDKAVFAFRSEVARFMEETGDKTPSIRGLLYNAAEALRLRPLPSEVDSSPKALRQMALSSLTVETVFGTVFQSGSDDEQEAVKSIAAHMRETGKTTTGKPEFRELTQAMIAAVGEAKQAIPAGTVDSYLGELKKTVQAPRPPEI